MPTADDSTYTLGVDIGTSNCRAAYWDLGKSKSIPIRFGRNFDQLEFPTAVVFSKFDPLGDCLIGQDALDAVLLHQDPNYPIANLVLQLPRLLGKKHSSISRLNPRRSNTDGDNNTNSSSTFDPRFICSTATRSYDGKVREMAHISLRMESDSGVPSILLIRPEEVLARIFIAIKLAADAQLPPESSGKTAKFVVACPSSFSNCERKAILDAAHVAGIPVLRLLSSAMAHATSMFMNHRSTFSQEHESIILELGGGYTSLTYALLDDGIADCHTTLGDSTMGGEDIDLRLVSYFINEYSIWKKKKEKLLKKKMEIFIDFESDPVAFLRLKMAMEKAKIELNTGEESSTEIFVPGNNNNNDDDNEESFSLILTKGRFEQICDDLFRPIVDLLTSVLAESKYVHRFDVVMVGGGSSRLSRVQIMIQEFLKTKLSVAETKNEKRFLQEFVPKMIKREELINTIYGTVEGASIYAALLGGFLQTSDILVIDVLPASLGLETAGGLMTKILSKNTSIPSKQNQVFSTFSDNQPAVSIQIFEGESTTTADCDLMAKFELGGLPPAPKGVPQIDVTFDIDANGILSVNAYEKSTGRSSQITVSNQLPFALTRAELENAMIEARRFSDEFYSTQKWFVEVSKNEREQFWTSLSSVSQFEYWKEAGGKAFSNKSYLESIRLWNLASTQDPTNAVVHSNMSFSFVKLNNRNKALEEAQNCVRKDEKWWKGYLRVAKVFELFDRDFEQAKEQFEKAKTLATEEKDVESLNKLIEEMNAKIIPQSSE